MQDRQIEQLNEIHSIMERSTRFISLSGISGVLAGCTGLAAIFIVFYKLDSLLLTPAILQQLATDAQLRISFYFYGTVTLVVAWTLATIFTIRKAHKKNTQIWDLSTRRFLFNLLLPLIAGGGFILGMIYHGTFSFVCAGLLIFYGVALLNIAKYTHDDLQYLAICELLLGILATFSIPIGLILLGIGFGFLNIFYGIYMYFKYEQ